MPSLFTILITIHVAGGTTGLITGAVAASVKKGSKLHNGSGKLYFYGMLLASLAALVISWLPNHHNMFLFAVGGFTLYMITSGYRMIHLKRQLKTTDFPIGVIDYIITLFAVVFGGICINYARLDYGLLNGKKPLKTHWMANHITRMMGGLVATYTAFLVVNVRIQQDWILWLLPTVVGTVLIAKFLKQYAPKSSK